MKFIHGGNAHDRRRSPTTRERRALERRWRRRAQDRRRHLLRFEAYNTWCGYIPGWPRVEEVAFSVEGQEERHAIEGALNAWSLANALREVGYGMLSAWAEITSSLDVVTVRARNYGVRLLFEITPGLVWTEVVTASSGEADRLPRRFKFTGRAR